VKTSMLFTQWMKDFVNDGSIPASLVLYKLLCSPWSRTISSDRTSTIYYELLAECCEANSVQISDPRGVSYRSFMTSLVEKYYFVRGASPCHESWIESFIGKTAISKLDALRHLSVLLHTHLLVSRLDDNTFPSVFEEMLTRRHDKEHIVRGQVFASFSFLKRKNWLLLQQSKADLVHAVVEMVLTSCDSALGGLRTTVFKALGDMINAGVSVSLNCRMCLIFFLEM
jgi:hypothetical protein